MTNFNPKISVLLAVHNGEKCVYDAIHSVLNQTYKNFELIIAVNGCTDNTQQLIFDIVSKIRGIKCHIILIDEANKSKALNEALHCSSGDFIAIQDADDIWLPTKLQEQIEHAQNYDVIGSNINYIDANGDNMPMEFKTSYLHEKIVEQAVSGKNPIANCTALISAYYLKEANGWDPYWEGIEDYELWLRLMTKTQARFTNVNKVLALHRVHNQSNFNSNPKFDGQQKVKELLTKYTK